MGRVGEAAAFALSARMEDSYKETDRAEMRGNVSWNTTDQEKLCNMTSPNLYPSTSKYQHSQRGTECCTSELIAMPGPGCQRQGVFVGGLDSCLEWSFCFALVSFTTQDMVGITMYKLFALFPEYAMNSFHCAVLHSKREHFNLRRMVC